MCICSSGGVYVLRGSVEGLCVGLCTQVQLPEEPRGVGAPGAGVKGSFKMPGTGTDPELQSSVKSACDPSHGVIPPAPHYPSSQL